MTTYAIGDLQGCLTPLQKLLDKVHFNPDKDVLWFVGDLVNRGPESLETLRFVKSLGSSAISVLGNHDLHLLAVMHGIRKASGKDTIQEILKAPDRDELEDWLRGLPLLHHDASLGFTMVHAGIHPHWDLPYAKAMATEVETVLRSDDYVDFLHRMYGNKPSKWSRKLGQHRRRRFTVNVFTRMRYCTNDGELEFSFNGPPNKAPKQLMPWYNVPKRRPLKHRILFGHWSSHPAFAVSNVIPLDRGCVWGGTLAALALETEVTTTVPGQQFTDEADQ